MSNSEENQNTKDIKRIEELTSKIEKTQAEIAYAKTAFEGNIELTVQELQESRNKIIEDAASLKDTLIKFKETKESLESIARILSITPDKIKAGLLELPKNFNESIANSIPNLSKELCKNIDATFNSGVESFKIYTEEIMKNTNSQINENLQKLKGNTDQLHFDMRQELRVYTEAFDKIIDRSDRFRTRRLFYTLLLSGAFSAVVSALTVWHMITYGIWLN